MNHILLRTSAFTIISCSIHPPSFFKLCLKKIHATIYRRSAGARQTRALFFVLRLLYTVYGKSGWNFRYTWLRDIWQKFFIYDNSRLHLENTTKGSNSVRSKRRHVPCPHMHTLSNTTPLQPALRRASKSKSPMWARDKCGTAKAGRRTILLHTRTTNKGCAYFLPVYQLVAF